MKEKLELYIHIPFCVKKCAYCDFLSAPAGEETRQKYVEALCLEIEGYRERYHDAYEVDSVFMGGGTPSILEGGQIEAIFQALREAFVISPQAEITIEANPGTVTEEKLSAWREAGINRVSLGLQSTNDEELRLLGRIHTYEQFKETYENVRKAGFSNVNVDLISAIPGQTVESWRRTLEKVAALDPEHVSAYSLIIEEGTPFHEWFEDGSRSKCPQVLPALPDEEEEREMYHLTERILSSYGYGRYEISNYAKEGYACRHNLGYWERREYLGIGLGASSLINHTRYQNTADMGRYLEQVGNLKRSEGLEQGEKPEQGGKPPWAEKTEKLTLADEMAEFLFLGLRKMWGVSATCFAESFGRKIDEVYKEPLQKLVDGGLLKVDDDRIFLTERGIDVSNMVFVEFLEPKL